MYGGEDGEMSERKKNASKSEAVDGVVDSE
jgi:hypothetical protein